MGGQNAMISKHSAAGRVGGNISIEALWQLRVRSVWVARMQVQAFCGGKGGREHFN